VRLGEKLGKKIREQIKEILGNLESDFRDEYELSNIDFSFSVKVPGLKGLVSARLTKKNSSKASS